jgi:hypothetical protein
MPNWKELSHAYGSAEDLPGIISALKPDPNAPAWDDLWSRVCHQGTTYSASPAVLPFLLRSASGWDAAARAMPLALAGSIVSAPQTTLSGYEQTVEALRVLALDTVKDRELSRNDRIHVMQSVLALQGDRLWGRVLDHLTDGEFPAVCPDCGKDLYVVVGKYGFFVAAGEWVQNSQTSRTEIRPLETEELTEIGNWLYSVCNESGDLELAGWIRYLFGVSKCPECRQTFVVADAISGIEEN